jgi:restriction endonuclease Mrr
MTGHAFEDLLAEILASLGFEDLSLRVQTVAGEVDILGFSEDRLGSRIGYIFELKQFGLSERPVSLDAITRLNGLRDGLKNKLGITEGVFVTTTHYTQPSKQAAAFHQIALKQYEHLVEWLRQYEFGTNGLFLQSIGE